MKEWCTGQQERGTVKLRGKELGTQNMSVLFNCKTIQSGGTAAVPLCTCLCVKDSRSRAQGRMHKGTKEISVLLLSHRRK